MNRIYYLLIFCLVAFVGMGTATASSHSESDPNPSNHPAIAGSKAAQFDLVKSWAIGDSLAANLVPGSAVSLTGVCYIHDKLWISKWNSDTLYKMDCDGSNPEIVLIPGVAAVRSITSDGTNLFMGAAGQSIYEVDPVNNSLVQTIALSGTIGARMCAYDPNADGGAGGFWLGNFSNGLQLVAKSGGAPIFSKTDAELGVAGLYGGTVDTISPGGPYVWLYAQDGATNNTLFQYDIANDTVTTVSFDVNTHMATLGSADGIAGGAHVSFDATRGVATVLTMTQVTPGIVTASELVPGIYGAPGDDPHFDCYLDGSYVGLSDVNWDTWSGTPGTGEDAMISTDFANSGDNSIRFEDATTDALYLMGDVTSGVWEVGMSIYVESGQSAYFNIQETEVAGTRWVIETNFDDGGTVSQSINGDTAAYSQDEWVDVRFYIDLDNDSIQYWVGGAPVVASSYTHNGGVTSLGSFDFYPDGGNGPGIRYYVDDMVYMAGTMPVWPGTGLQDRAQVKFAMYPNPAASEVNIENAIKGYVDVKVMDVVGKTYKSTSSNESTIRIDVSDLESGVYFVEISNATQRGIQKLVIK